jgi:hypothetical protein
MRPAGGGPPAGRRRPARQPDESGARPRPPAPSLARFRRQRSGWGPSASPRCSRPALRPSCRPWAGVQGRPARLRPPPRSRRARPPSSARGPPSARGLSALLAAWPPCVLGGARSREAMQAHAARICPTIILAKSEPPPRTRSPKRSKVECNGAAGEHAPCPHRCRRHPPPRGRRRPAARPLPQRAAHAPARCAPRAQGAPLVCHSGLPCGVAGTPRSKSCCWDGGRN